MFWGCFSHLGVGPLITVDGMMNSKQYVTILRRQVIPELRRRFPGNDGIFQQDLAPCHHIKVGEKMFHIQKAVSVELAGKFTRFEPNRKSLGHC